MFQRLFQRRIYPSCFSVLQNLFLWAILFFPIVSFSQTDSLQVTFDFVSIQDTTIRGLSAGFPYPVISVLTVKDQTNRYVHDLADSSRWLSPTDTTQSGVLVDSIWKTILEYHKENTHRPENPDVKQTNPPYMVTEVYGLLGVSVALVMDYSGGFAPYYDDAEAAARAFVRQMRKNDRSAIVKFGGEAQVLQEFTSDTTELIEKINEDFLLWGGTALYDGIYLGINECFKERSRKTRTAVVVYTDGGDSAPSVHSLEEVITFAQSYSIPVYTIGLGDSLQHSEIKQIAAETGGIYEYAPSVEDLTSIYLSIYGLIHGNYVLAHTSPDPFFNGTVRTIDLTLENDNAVGRGLGYYQAPFQPSDVSVMKQVITDSISVEDGDTLHYVMTGDTAAYEITVTNNGPSIVSHVEVVDFLPDSLALVDSEANAVQWLIPQIEVGETVHLYYRCYVDTLRTPIVIPLVNRVFMVCDLDTFPQNNRDSGIVYYVPLPPPDISVKKQGIGTSVAVIQGDSTWYVSPGDTAVYHVSLVNRGRLDGYNISVRDILPQEVTLIDFAGSEFSLDGDTLRWTVDQVDANGGKENFTYRCFVDTLMLPENSPLINQVLISCAKDTNLKNNTDGDTLLYSPLLPADVSVMKRGVGDSLVVDHGDSVWYVRPGNIVEYNVSVFNTGQISCRNILCYDLLPEEVVLINFSEPSSWQSGDTLYWSVNHLYARGGKKEFTYTCRVDTFMPPWEVPLMNHVTVDCEEDINLENNSARDTVWVTALIPPDPQVRVTPSEVEAGDSVQVEVMTPVDVKDWDLSIFFENNIWIDTYGDEFIQSHVLKPKVWTTIVPDFGETWMSTDKNQERVGVIFEILDLWDVAWSDTAYFTLLRTDPQVRVSPSQIEPKDSIQVEVMTPVDVQGWDLSIFFENNEWIDTYGDAFIQSHVLEPDVWTTVVPDFADTWMRTNEEQERIGVVFQTWNLWNVTRLDTAYFTLQSADEFLLDENIFKPAGGTPLGMRFMLSSNRRAEIKLYDISGGFVKTVVDGPYNAGWNVVTWDGRDENSLIVGSGVYVAIFSSGNFQKARKFILIR